MWSVPEGCTDSASTTWAIEELNTNWNTDFVVDQAFWRLSEQDGYPVVLRASRSSALIPSDG